MKLEQMTTEQLIDETNRRRHAMECQKARYRMGEGSYEALAAAAKAFAEVFEVYHLSRFGKRKRIDWRAVIR